MRYYTLGIVGLGQVGSRVASMARTFGITVFAHDPYIEEKAFADRGAFRVLLLDELLARCDIVTTHVPLTAETRRMIGEAQIGSMRRGTILINAARGEIVDQRAALSALASNHLGGLALDVFDPEPPDGPFPDDPRLILTPHVGGCTYECRTAIGEKLFLKIVEHEVHTEVVDQVQVVRRIDQDEICALLRLDRSDLMCEAQRMRPVQRRRGDRFFHGHLHLQRRELHDDLHRFGHRRARIAVTRERDDRARVDQRSDIRKKLVPGRRFATVSLCASAVIPASETCMR